MTKHNNDSVISYLCRSSLFSYTISSKPNGVVLTREVINVVIGDTVSVNKYRVRQSCLKNVVYKFSVVLHDKIYTAIAMTLPIFILHGNMQ